MNGDETKLFRGQRYELARTEEITLLVWRSDCADCGEPFEFKTSSRVRKFEPNRRCQSCKKPGLRVAWQDGPRPQAVELGEVRSSVLKIVATTPTATMAQIAAQTSMSKSRVQRIFVRLAQDRFIYKCGGRYRVTGKGAKEVRA